MDSHSSWAAVTKQEIFLLYLFTHPEMSHKLLYLLCEANISSQADYITDNPFQGFLNPYRDIMVKHRFVFL